ncbi:hypothetical protein PCL_11127 [Purpureocillium lilacinum]|uniref:Uncharacterized protein n=1 Tax=Purpureocillium lilacinum TaxID=33203 RepID=A0A2U3EDA2_PURLI|nr:hypothetical protein PCL_11127 [Purpureocillium lilacinum]
MAPAGAPAAARLCAAQLQPLSYRGRATGADAQQGKGLAKNSFGECISDVPTSTPACASRVSDSAVHAVAASADTGLVNRTSRVTERTATSRLRVKRCVSRDACRGGCARRAPGAEAWVAQVDEQHELCLDAASNLRADEKTSLQAADAYVSGDGGGGGGDDWLDWEAWHDMGMAGRLRCTSTGGTGPQKKRRTGILGGTRWSTAQVTHPPVRQGKAQA